MKVKIDFLPEFMRLAKPLWKKYASFEQDYMSLLDELRSNPFVGTPLGEGVRKVRMTISSKGRFYKLALMGFCSISEQISL